MRVPIFGVLIGCASALAVTAAQAAKLDLEAYMGSAKSTAVEDLKAQGFSPVGHVEKDGLKWELLWNGETCIAIHGKAHLVDDIDTFRPHECRA